ncbi:MAG: TadE/TadG family type IV pilus assembly protein [Candidatus Dormibacteria bacterium]|jgi:Flp pilus assembly protein TadG
MRRRDGRRGQAMVEMALLLPVLMLLFLGSWTAANLIDDNNAAAQATRAGARLGAELGNGSALGLTQNQIDVDILDQVYPIVSPQLTNAKVTEIDIYQPSGCTGTTPFATGTCPPNNGAYTAGELIDTYTVTGGVVSNTCGTCTFTLANRSQTHPNEAELGVRLVFKYTSPALTFFTQTDSQYTVMRLAPTS